MWRNKVNIQKLFIPANNKGVLPVRIYGVYRQLARPKLMWIPANNKEPLGIIAL